MVSLLLEKLSSDWFELEEFSDSCKSIVVLGSGTFLISGKVILMGPPLPGLFGLRLLGYSMRTNSDPRKVAIFSLQ